jgi:hypothetical protein
LFPYVRNKFFTFGELCENKKATTEDAMLKEAGTVLARSPRAVFEDALGVMTLFVLLIAGLHLPQYL